MFLGVIRDRRIEIRLGNIENGQIFPIDSWNVYRMLLIENIPVGGFHFKLVLYIDSNSLKDLLLFSRLGGLKKTTGRHCKPAAILVFLIQITDSSVFKMGVKLRNKYFQASGYDNQLNPGFK